MKKWTAVHWEMDYDKSGWEYYETIDWEANKEEIIQDMQNGWGGCVTNTIQLRTRALKWHLRRNFTYLPKYPERR